MQGIFEALRAANIPFSLVYDGRESDHPHDAYMIGRSGAWIVDSDVTGFIIQARRGTQLTGPTVADALRDIAKELVTVWHEEAQ